LAALGVRCIERQSHTNALRSQGIGGDHPAKGTMATQAARLAESMTVLAQLSVVDHSMVEILGRLAALANDTLDRSCSVGLTLETKGALGTPVFTDERVPEIDEWQYKTGAGPCVDAFRTGEIQINESTPNDDRWPQFSAVCEVHGILSTLSVPVSNGNTLGALNFYASSEGPFDRDDVDVAAAFAAQAAIVVDHATAYWTVRDLADQLTEALESRVVIEQAKGILIASGKTGDEAFDVLRRASQTRNRKLRDVAADLVAKAERRANAAR
jgi:GAF domain-containing protein